MDFIGIDTQYPCADGHKRRRIHLDGAASPLASQTAVDAIHTLLPHYSNSHSYVHSSAQISTRAFAWAEDVVLDYFAADKSDYTVIFMGNGCTAVINRLARGLNQRCTDRPAVLVSAMEHHANDLPHRLDGNAVEYLRLSGTGPDLGAIDIGAATSKISELGDTLNYVACSSISNVTGISNDWPALAELAHTQGGYIIVDAAQSVAHQSLAISAMPIEQQPDFFVFSGHKLYAPMAPGVLLAKRSALYTLKGQDMGGGSVADVSPFDFELLDTLPDREQSGTPNIVGAVALAGVMRSLASEGLSQVEAREAKLMARLIDGLAAMPSIRVYGNTSISAESKPGTPRLGAVSFNHSEIPQGLLAGILNDYYAIAVRNGCFCAHPYVSELIKPELWELDLDSLEESGVQQAVNQRRGMVRASVSHYTSEADIDALLDAISEIEQRIEELKAFYAPNADGSFSHTVFRLDWESELDGLI